MKVTMARRERRGIKLCEKARKGGVERLKREGDGRKEGRKGVDRVKGRRWQKRMSG